MIKKYILSIVLAVCIFGCAKKTATINSDFFLQQQESFSIYNGNTVEKLPVALSKIKQVLGNIEPVTFKQMNINSDISLELLFFYKTAENPDIQFVIFDILPNDTLKKVYELQTNIRKQEELSVQYSSLLFEDDNCITIEGIGEADKRLLYIIKNVDNGTTFKVIGSFSASYSVFFDMEEKEVNDGSDNRSKYYILKEIVLIDSALSLTSTNIQRKDVYVWNYDKERFVLAESSRIVSEENADIPISVLYSAENYYNYLKGFWYQKRYAKELSKNELNIENVQKEGLQYVNFREDNGNKVIDVSYGSYSDHFEIDKLIKLGGQKPGLRLSLKKENVSDMYYYRYIDIYLLGAKELQMKTPEVFGVVNYVQLDQPLFEYIAEAKEKKKAASFDEIEKKLTGKFSCDFFSMTIKDDKRFTVTTETKEETGYYQLEERNGDCIVSLFFDNTNSIINEKYFLFDGSNNDRLVFLPVQLNFDNTIVKNTKPMIFNREQI
ncbi:MAG: hypothetical protein II258_04690 [Spirochaetales bacterium]|nr:hypothetical protein [Spirochaetales bacterium]